MNVKEIANKARNSISKICIDECKALCCRKSHLALSGEEIELVTQKKILDLDIKKDSYLLDLNKGCPSLKDNLCMIHKKPNRPNTCKEFPIFIEDKTIRFASGCLAVKMDSFYPYVHKFLKLGYKIM